MISMKKSSILLIAVAAVALASCKGGSSSLGGDNGYPVDTASTSSTVIETSYPGSIKGIQDVEIRPKVQGFITDIKVRPGQNVGLGQLLFVIDNETYQAAVNQAQAAINSAQAQLNTAKLTYENSQKLFDNNVIGAYELTSAKNSYEAAEAALAEAKANYAAAKQNLDFCFVKSPANGVVGDLPFKVGALVSSSMTEPFTTVSDINTISVYFSMPEKEILELTREFGGLEATVAKFPPVKLQLSDGTVYDNSGTVVAISGVIDATTGAILLRADFPNPQHLLKSGGAGSILVPHTNSEVIIIPQEAVAQVQDKYFVYLVGDDNKVKYTEVTVDSDNDGNNYTITSGMEVGNKYVLKGVSALSDGMEITPLTEKEYQDKINHAQEMGADQGSLSKIKKDLSN